jgi:hypothetical protein
MEKTKFLEVTPGNNSNSRLLVWAGFAGALLLAILVLIAGLYLTKEPQVVATATAAGSLFTVIISPFLVLLGHNKRQEVKTRNNV